MGRAAKGSLPLIVGVTGHRDLRPDDEPRLRHLVARIFERLRRRCPHTPIVLLSPLADGADRLVAEVALEAPTRAQLVVPIPLDEALYEQDFTQPGSLEAYRTLRRQASHTIPMPIVAGSSLAEASVPGTARDKQYAAVGAYVVRSSQVLIALWDGDEGMPGSEAMGGTAQIVRWWRSGIEPPFATNTLDVGRGGTLWHVVTPRAKGGAPNGRVASCRPIWGPPAGGQSTDAHLQAEERVRARRSAYGVLRAIETCNADIATIDGAAAAKSRGDVFRDPDAAKDLALLTDGERKLLDRYGDIDALALSNQTSLIRRAQAVFVLAFLSVVAYEFFAHVFELSLRSLGLYLLCFASAALVHLRSRETERQHFNYRALAEGLRTLLFWTVAGIPGQLADHYLRLQRSDVDGIRESLVALSVATRRPDATPGDWKGRADLLLRRWIQPQLAYFKRRSVQNVILVRRTRWGAQALLFAGLSVALAALVSLTRPPLVWTSMAIALNRVTLGVVVAAVLVQAIDEMVAWRRGRLPEIESPRNRLAHVLVGTSCFGAVLTAVAALVETRGGLPIGGNDRGTTGVLAVSGVAAAVGIMLIPFRRLRTAVHLHEEVHRIEGWVPWIASLVPGIACIMVMLATIVSTLPSCLGEAGAHGAHPECLDVLIAATPILIAAGALLRAYSEVRAHESEAKRYEVMSSTYAAAEKRLMWVKEYGTEEEMRQLVFDIARDALVENGEWLLMHRDRPLQVPAGG